MFLMFLGMVPKALKSLELVRLGTDNTKKRHWKMRSGAYFLKISIEASIGMIFSTYPESLIDFRQRITASEHFPLTFLKNRKLSKIIDFLRFI